jgi:hypothetical protein
MFEQSHETSSRLVRGRLHLIADDLAGLPDYDSGDMEATPAWVKGMLDRLPEWLHWWL